MLSYKFKGFAAALALLLLAGCAEEPSESWQDNELMLLNAVQKMDFPGATQFPGYTDGSLWLISHAKVGSGATPNDGDYVAFDYTGRLLPSMGERVFQTTDSTMARRLGTFAYTTHFAPIFMQYTTTMQSALQIALREMHVGDTVEVLSASWLAFGANGSSSWSGEVSLPANTPITFRVILREIAPKPEARDSAIVQHYVDSINELRSETFVQAKDSAGNLLKGFYISYVDTVPLDTAIRLDSAARYAASGDRVSVKYAGYYLQDNFLLDTNIDSVATKHSWVISTTDSTFFTYDFTKDASNENVIKAMHIALHNVAPGSWVEAVFTSDYGYGSVGNPQVTLSPIYPYTPLRFRIFVAKITKKE
jgi:FKBP-type peptidyl-prolyl cis-trans isomerase